METVAALALEHLLLRLRPLNRALRAAVEHQSQLAARLIRPDVTPLCVTDEQVKTLLADADLLLCEGRVSGQAAALEQAELVVQEQLRRQSAALGIDLPLDQLAHTADLCPFEEEVVLLCAMPELDRSYERIYAYILDDLYRRSPCVELLCALTATSLAERVGRRHMLGGFGRLRRTGVVRAYGEPTTELRQELRLAPGLFEFLTGATVEVSSFCQDTDAIAIPRGLALPPEVDQETISHVGEAIRERRVAIVGVWGERHSGYEEVALALASATGRPLRRWLPIDPSRQSLDHERKLREGLQIAAALGAVLLVPTDALNEPEYGLLSQTVAACLAGSHVPAILTGSQPWRPTALLEARLYAELELEGLSYTTRKAMWEHALPDVSEQQLDSIAARFHMSAPEVRAAAQVARTQAQIASNGRIVPVGDQLEAACTAVTRQHSAHFAVVVKPKRGPEDLILPTSLHQQVLEVAQFFRVWPRVAEGWGFGRLVTGKSGIKVLFSGDSGTGKTLAAEVIASVLRMPLLKVDLARVVSKWVGETEKHLETAFREAEESHAILFFDEADALFGKRGEVQHGTDRYANLEVSFLLQRLEDHAGLAILASNLKDNIDMAFTRRFQLVVHFPRPEPPERRRIWEIAFPKTAPVDGGIDFDMLARLDLTGAGIVGAARTAALLAADEMSPTITMAHIVRAIARQYRQEARILTTSELGPYAAFLQEAR
jgi:ATPase family protein associated with various cellular activities (AAA)/winged helix domain-containing protein